MCCWTDAGGMQGTHAGPDAGAERKSLDGQCGGGFEYPSTRYKRHTSGFFSSMLFSESSPMMGGPATPPSTIVPPIARCLDTSSKCMP
eukprot:scaffold926_cov248-Pinguiococcus_pyrenoidosus.AAC.8